MWSFIVSFVPRAIVQGIPLLFGCVGETVTEKSGNLNLGTAGTMYVGAISAVIGAFYYEQSTDVLNPVLGILIPIITCLLGSLIMGLIYSFLTVTLRANQNVTGLALTTFGVGVGNFFGGSLIKISGLDVPSIALTKTSALFSKKLPFGGANGFTKLFFNYGFMTYVAIVIAILAGYFLSSTRKGLHLRAVGESPATADAAGINVTRYKYVATCAGSMIAGLGGLYYVLDYACGLWSNDTFGDRGWLAVALVIFTIWRPKVAIPSAFLFGGLYILYLYIPSGTNLAIQEIYKMLPYVVTMVVLVLSSMRNARDKQPPASLGLPYFREDR